MAAESSSAKAPTHAEGSTPPTDGPASQPAGGGSARLRWVVPILVVCALLALAWPKSAGKSAPDGRLEDFDGAGIRLVDRLAPVSLVHYWATWCAPCVEEMPKLQRFERELAGNELFELVMVAVADDRRKAADFIGPATITLFDDWRVAKTWGTKALPETHLVVDGVIVHTFVGAQDWDAPEVRRKVTDALGAR